MLVWTVFMGHRSQQEGSVRKVLLTVQTSDSTERWKGPTTLQSCPLMSECVQCTAVTHICIHSNTCHCCEGQPLAAQELKESHGIRGLMTQLDFRI